MTTKSQDTGKLRLIAALIGVICAGGVAAQERLDTRDLARPQVQTATCAEVNWDRAMLESYPRIADACQEVVISQGVKWARFEADLQSNNRDGTVTLDFKDRQNRSIGDVTVLPAATQRVSIQGREYRFSELTRGQTLNLFVPEGMFAVAMEPGAPPEQLAQIVTQPREQLAQAQQPAQAQQQPAQARTTVAQRLPDTAGPLPLLAAAGFMALLGGIGLTIRRRFFSARS
jgi:hypothetical protein